MATRTRRVSGNAEKSSIRKESDGRMNKISDYNKHSPPRKKIIRPLALSDVRESERQVKKISDVTQSSTKVGKESDRQMKKISGAIQSSTKGGKESDRQMKKISDVTQSSTKGMNNIPPMFLKRKRTIPPLPSLLFSNVKYLDHKLDDLHIRFKYDRLFSNSCILAFFETSLDGIMNVEDIAVSGFTTLVMDRSAALRKSRPGGLCIYINNKWCSTYKFCTALCTENVEILTLLMQPHSFPEVIISFVLVPLEAEVPNADRVIRTSLEETQALHSQVPMFIMGFFNSSCADICPYQYVKCITRKDQISEMCYGNIRKAYKAKHHSPLGRADGSIIELFPATPQIFKQRVSSNADANRETCDVSDDVSKRGVIKIIAKNTEQEQELQGGQQEVKEPVMYEILQQSHLGESQNMQVNTHEYERNHTEHQKHTEEKQEEHTKVHGLQQKNEEIKQQEQRKEAEEMQKKEQLHEQLSKQHEQEQMQQKEQQDKQEEEYHKQQVQEQHLQQQQGQQYKKKEQEQQQNEQQQTQQQVQPRDLLHNAELQEEKQEKEHPVFKEEYTQLVLQDQPQVQQQPEEQLKFQEVVQLPEQQHVQPQLQDENKHIREDQQSKKEHLKQEGHHAYESQQIQAEQQVQDDQGSHEEHHTQKEDKTEEVHPIREERKSQKEQSQEEQETEEEQLEDQLTQEEQNPQGEQKIPEIQPTNEGQMTHKEQTPEEQKTQAEQQVHEKRLTQDKQQTEEQRIQRHQQAHDEQLVHEKQEQTHEDKITQEERHINEENQIKEDKQIQEQEIQKEQQTPEYVKTQTMQQREENQLTQEVQQAQENHNAQKGQKTKKEEQPISEELYTKTEKQQKTPEEQQMKNEQELQETKASPEKVETREKQQTQEEQHIQQIEHEQIQKSVPQEDHLHDERQQQQQQHIQQELYEQEEKVRLNQSQKRLKQGEHQQIHEEQHEPEVVQKQVQLDVQQQKNKRKKHEQIVRQIESSCKEQQRQQTTEEKRHPKEFKSLQEKVSKYRSEYTDAEGYRSGAIFRAYDAKSTLTSKDNLSHHSYTKRNESHHQRNKKGTKYIYECRPRRRKPQPLTLGGFMRHESQEQKILFPPPPSFKSSGAGRLQYRSHTGFLDDINDMGVPLPGIMPHPTQEYHTLNQYPYGYQDVFWCQPYYETPWALYNTPYGNSMPNAETQNQEYFQSMKDCYSVGNYEQQGWMPGQSLDWYGWPTPGDQWGTKDAEVFDSVSQCGQEEVTRDVLDVYDSQTDSGINTDSGVHTYTGSLSDNLSSIVPPDSWQNASSASFLQMEDTSEQSLSKWKEKNDAERDIYFDQNVNTALQLTHERKPLSNQDKVSTIGDFPLRSDSIIQDFDEEVNLCSSASVCCVHADTEAVTVCQECNDPLCQSCAEAHKKLSMSRDHILLDLSVLLTESLTSDTEVENPESDISGEMFSDNPEVIINSELFPENPEIIIISEMNIESNPITEIASVTPRDSDVDTRIPLKHADASEFAKDIRNMQKALPDMDLELDAMAEYLACMAPTSDEDVQGALEEMASAFKRVEHSVQVCRERLMCSGVMQSQEQEIDHREETLLTDSRSKQMTKADVLKRVGLEEMECRFHRIESVETTICEQSWTKEEMALVQEQEIDHREEQIVTTRPRQIIVSKTFKTHVSFKEMDSRFPQSEPLGNTICEQNLGEEEMSLLQEQEIDRRENQIVILRPQHIVAKAFKTHLSFPNTNGAAFRQLSENGTNGCIKSSPQNKSDSETNLQNQCLDMLPDTDDKGHNQENISDSNENVNSSLEAKEHVSNPLLSEVWQTSLTFSSQGGQMQGRESDVVLYVPENAIDSSSDVTIYGAVSTDLEAAHTALRLDKTQTIVSPIAEYTSGDHIRFQKALWVVLPHFLPKTFSPEMVRVFQFHQDDSGSFIVEQLHPQNSNEHKDNESDIFFFMENKRLCLLVSHFTGFVCTLCRRDLEPFLLELSVYGTHRQRDKRKVNISLFAWDGRLRIKDFEKNVLKGQDKDLQLITIGQIDPAPNDKDIFLGMEMAMSESAKEAWQHSVMEGQQVFSTATRISLGNMYVQNDGQSHSLNQSECTNHQNNGALCNSCFYNKKPSQVSWTLEEKRGSTFTAWFECAIRVGYIREFNPQCLKFLEEVLVQTLHVRGLEMEVKSDAGSQTDMDTTNDTHVKKLPTNDTRPLMSEDACTASSSNNQISSLPTAPNTLTFPSTYTYINIKNMKGNFGISADRSEMTQTNNIDESRHVTQRSVISQIVPEVRYSRLQSRDVLDNNDAPDDQNPSTTILSSLNGTRPRPVTMSETDSRPPRQNLADDVPDVVGGSDAIVPGRAQIPEHPEQSKARGCVLS